MPYLNGDQLMYTIHIELEKNFNDVEIEGYDDFYIDIDEEVQELDFEQE